MLRPGNVICSVRPRKAIVGLFATFASIALLPCGVALADSVTTNFEPNAAPPFNLGSVNGQGMVNGMPGWKSAVAGQESCPPFSPYDQEVVQNSQFYSGGVTGFGQQSLRFSNLVACGEFTYQTYSTPVQDPAGENETNKVYTAQFSLIPTTPKFQDGLYVSVSPDDYTGARMFRVDLTDTPSGVLVGVAYATGPDGDFAFAPNLAVLDPSVPHTIKVSMKVNPGDTSDLVRVSIDGADTGQCFGSWKDYYLAVEKRQMPPDINSLQFRASRSGFTMKNAGYLFDNVTVDTSNGAGPAGCDVKIDKEADAPTVTAGSLAGYRITVRNRGRVSERNLLLCDHIPNHTTFVSADRKLRRMGRRRCLMIPRLRPGQRTGVHVDLRVAADAPPGNLANIADITPVPPPGVPVVPGVPPVFKADLPPGAAVAPLTPLQKVRVVVKVLRAKRTPPPPAPPPVTG